MSSTGRAGARHVRVALTATDERVAQLPERLGRPSDPAPGVLIATSR